MHTMMPENVDIYMEESLKAGKNCSKGDCMLFYRNNDYETCLDSLADNYRDKMKRANSGETKRQLLAELRQRTSEVFDVVAYVENITTCRQVYLLNHLNGNNVTMPCEHCDICEITRESVVLDVADILRKVLMAVWTVNKRQKERSDKEDLLHVTIPCLIDLLQGNAEDVEDSNQWVMKEWFFASFSSWEQKFLKMFIFILISKKFVLLNHSSSDKLAILQNLVITPRGQDFLKNSAEVSLRT